MSKIFIFISVVAFICYGCGHRIDSADLNRIDSLVSTERYDSAYREVLKINPQEIVNPEDKAHYNLLLTQTSVLTEKQMPSDSLIDSSISFYEKVGDKEHLCDAYYYKAEVYVNKGEYEQAIIFAKKAESLAYQTKIIKQKLKIAELIAYINRERGNYDLELKYAKQSLNNARELKKGNWIVHSYCRISELYQTLKNTDSAIFYADNTFEWIKSADTAELPYYLNSIGYAYIEKNPQKAKDLFEKSLSYKTLSRTLENLAWVYHLEGNENKAYEYWKQALLVDDNVPKANVLHNILQYDLEHHNIDGACERLYSIVSIKDSLNNVLKDRTIQRIQQEFDEKATQEKHDQEVLRWVVAAMALVIIVLLLLGYIQYRRHKARMLLAEHQMLIANYQSEINMLKSNQEGTEQQIAELNKKINDLIEQDSPRLYHGKMLYDQIVENGTTVTWTKEDYNCFVDYYKAKDFASYSKIVRKHHPKTVHNTLFLILYEIGKDDKDVRRIMGITQEAIRSTRFRINKNAKK